MTETPIDDDSPHTDSPSLWQENHGNWLLGGVVVILLVGASILWYQQTRFVPAPFPEPSLFEAASDSPDDAADDQPRVVVMVSGAVNDFGRMMVAVYDSEDNFNQPAMAVLQRQLELTDGQASWSVPIAKLPEQLAIAAYHDENSDETLNKNAFGIPTERYGYSRNARGLTGPPSFEQAVIERPDESTQIDVFVR